MNGFRDGQRVRVVGTGHPVYGKTGVVVHLLHADGYAWVRMDEPVPTENAVFGDDDPRRDNVLLHPHDCETASGMNPKSN